MNAKNKTWGYREDPETLSNIGTPWEVYDPTSVLRDTASIAKVYRVGEAGEAHARLLAAAPDLLTALKAILAITAQNGGTERDADALHAIEIAATHAIARAALEAGEGK